MNIAIFSDRYYPSIDGIAVHVGYISRLLSERGHTVHLFVPKPEKKKDVLPSTKNLVMRYMPSITAPMNDVRMALPFSFSLLNKDFIPDVVHFHTTFTVGLEGILMAKMLGIPIVGTFHTYFMEPEYLKSIGVKKMTLDKLNKTNFVNKAGWNYANFFYNKADVVIAPTHYTKKDLEDNKVSSKIIVVSNGIDCSISKKKKLNFDLPQQYLLYIGRVSIEKNLSKLVRAYATFQKKHPHIELVIVGDGPYKKELERTVKNYKLQNKVIFLGKVENRDIMTSNIFDNALAFVTASKIENQPISVLEAMKYGLPVIGVSSRGMTGLIQKNGILCKNDALKELAEAMSKMVTDQEFRSLCSTYSIKLANDHSVENTLDQLETIYKKLAHNNTKRNKKTKHNFMETIAKTFNK